MYPGQDLSSSHYLLKILTFLLNFVAIMGVWLIVLAPPTTSCSNTWASSNLENILESTPYSAFRSVWPSPWKQLAIQPISESSNWIGVNVFQATWICCCVSTADAEHTESILAPKNQLTPPHTPPPHTKRPLFLLHTRAEIARRIYSAFLLCTFSSA